MVTLGHELFNTNLMLMGKDIVFVIKAIAISAPVLGLLNIDQDLVGESQMHEWVHSSSVFFQKFCLCDVAGVVCKNEAILCSSSQSEQLEHNLFFANSFLISCVYHVLYLKEKLVIVFFINASLFGNVCKELVDWNNWDTKVNWESPSDLVSENVRRTKESDFRGSRPSFDKTLVLIENALFHVSWYFMQHLLIIINHQLLMGSASAKFRSEGCTD
jgi:hypothetical protein